MAAAPHPAGSPGQASPAHAAHPAGAPPPVGAPPPPGTSPQAGAPPPPPPGASPQAGAPPPPGASPTAGAPPPADHEAAAAGAEALPPPPPPIADTGEAGHPAGAAIQPAPGTFVTTTAADAPVAQVQIDPNKKEGPKKEFMAAVKSYEEIVGANVIRGKMYLESKPQYEAGGPMGMGGGGPMGMGGGFDRPMGMGYPGPMPYPPPMGMGGYDRPPMGYEGQMGGYGYDRPPMGGYGYDRPPMPPPPDMYGPPRDRAYSPDRARYSPDYDRPPMDRRERPRIQRDDEYYYDELPKGRSETKVPVKKESENRAERVIQRIRQDIEAFDKDEGAVEDATNVPGSKPSESMERKPRAGPIRALWKATDDYEDEPPPARRSPRQRSSSHRSRDEGDDYDDYDDKRRSRRKRSKTRYDYDDEDRPRRGRSRRDESSSSSSSDGRRQRRKRHDSDDYDRGRSSSRRRRGSEDYGDKYAKRSRSRSKRRDEEEDVARASSRQRKSKGGEGLVSRPTEDRNFMQAGMLYRYESQPLMLVKGDVYKEEVAAAPAPEAGQEGGQKPQEGAPQQARFLPPDQYQDFLLGARAGKRPLGYPVRATPSAVAEELGRYHDFLGSVMPEGAHRDAMAAEVGKYHSFILGTGNAALRGTSPEREKKFTEFLLASDKGVARVVKPVPPAEAAPGAAGTRPPPGYQAFTVQAKPTLVPKPPVKEEVQPPPPQYHGFAVQIKAPPPPPPCHEFAVQAKPTPPPPSHGFAVQAKPTPPPPSHGFALQAKPPPSPPPPQSHGFALQAKPSPSPESDSDDMARRTSSDNMFTMQTRPQRMPSRMKGERYEHMEDTPQLKTEWWSRAAGAYDDMRPPSRSRSMRGRRGIARSASPRMVSPRRKAYEDDNGDAYQVTSLEMEGPMSNQYAQMRISRRGRDPNRMYSTTRRMSPTAAGYGGPPRRASPEMIGMGGGVQGMPMQGMQMQGMQLAGMQGMQMQGMPMQGMPMQGMPMQGMPMQGMPMQGAPMQGAPMQGAPMQGMGMQPMGMQPMGMPMQAMPMQPMPAQGMPVQYDPRSGRVPMRMDRRIQQMLSQQPQRGRYSVPPMEVAAAMPVQAQDGVLFKYQIQNESRQRQSNEGDAKDQGSEGKDKGRPATKDELIETSKEVSVEKVVSSHEVQVTEKRMSKATSARVKTRSSAAATHDAGSTRNAEAQAEIEDQMPHVSFTRNPNYDSPPPGFPFPMGPLPVQSPMFPPPAPPPPLPVQTMSSTYVHTHQHHHHYHDAQKNYQIAYLLPKSGDVRKLAQDRYEDQEPLGAAVGVQCLSLYERFMNWIYPDTKQTEDVSLMTDADELCDDKKRPGKKGKKALKKGEKDADGKSEESKKGDKKSSESEADTKTKPAEGEGKEKEGEEEGEKKKVPPGPPIPVNLPWQGHEYEYEEEIKPDGSRVGRYRYKGLGGAPKLPEGGATESNAMVSSKEPVTFETTTTRMESDGQQFWQREIKPIPAEARMEAMMPMKQMAESHESYQRDVRQHPSRRSFSGPQRRFVQTTKKVPRTMERGAVAKTGGADNFVPDVQIRLDFGDTSENSGSRDSKTVKSEASAAWQPADMVVSYAHKSFDDKHVTDDEDEDDDDEMLPSGHSYGGHGSTKKLIRRGRKIRGMPNKELMAYSMVVLVAVVGLALLITMTGHRSQARHTFGLDRHLVLNASKFKVMQAVPGGNAFWNAAPVVCKDARCLTKGSAAVRHLPRDYLKSACSDFYQFVCAHQNTTDSPRMVAHRALEDGVLGVIKAQEKYPELMTARQLYKECLNKEAISERGWDPLAELQESTDLGGWPFTDPVQQPLVWRAAGRTLRRFSLAALLSLGVERHPHKHGANILSVGHPELLVPTSLGNRSVKWYYGAVMHALAPFRERIVTPVFAVEVSAFESRLANMVRPQPRMAVQRLAERSELAEFLSVALENITRVTKATEFLVKDVDYVNDLVDAIKETAPHIVLNYLGFREVVVASPFLPSKLQALSALGRSPALRKEICLAVVAESLPAMSLYAGFNAFKQGLNNFKTANISGATKDVVLSFVKKMSWMDDATKAKVAKKILNTHVKTFHPSWISDKFKVFAQHENVPMVTENEGLRSYTAIRKALFENTLKAEAAHIEERWIGTILDPQCSFDAQGTSIYAPISFWNVSSPSTDNFLMMHMPDTLPRISHCLMATLLREGGTSDHENPYSKPLWSAATKKHFSNVRHCFTKQLSGTASENASTTELLSVVADAAALSPSFKIYKKFVSQKNIDGKSFEKTLNMNVDQFFFVSYASSYCGNSPPAKPSHHSEVTNRDRVNTALKNSPEFHAAFQCPSTRAMNPEHKCHLWRTS